MPIIQVSSINALTSSASLGQVHCRFIRRLIRLLFPIFERGCYDALEMISSQSLWREGKMLSASLLDELLCIGLLVAL